MCLRTDDADRRPQSVDRMEFVPAMGLLCAFNKGQRREYPVGNISQLELEESPVGDEVGE
jgi:hypothetical protein